MTFTSRVGILCDLAEADPGVAGKGSHFGSPRGATRDCHYGRNCTQKACRFTHPRSRSRSHNRNHIRSRSRSRSGSRTKRQRRSRSRSRSRSGRLYTRPAQFRSRSRDRLAIADGWTCPCGWKNRPQNRFCGGVNRPQAGYGCQQPRAGLEAAPASGIDVVRLDEGAVATRSRDRSRSRGPTSYRSRSRSRAKDCEIPKGAASVTKRDAADDDGLRVGSMVKLVPGCRAKGHMQV